MLKVSESERPIFARVREPREREQEGEIGEKREEWRGNPPYRQKERGRQRESRRARAS
jgi:hypothetical protein